MNNVLIKYNTDYADEFDIVGFEIVDGAEYLSRFSVIKKYFEYMQLIYDIKEYNEFYVLEQYFGTNEYLEITIEDIEGGFFSVEDIPSDEINIITKYLGNYAGVSKFFRNTYNNIVNDFEDFKSLKKDKLTEQEQNEVYLKHLTNLMKAE